MTNPNHLYSRDDAILGSLSLVVSTTLPDVQIADFDPDYPGTLHSWFRIQPTSALPTITEPVIIDGYTQPGASPNTQAIGSDATLLIELDGSDAGNANGLEITAGNSTVRGLVINRFTARGIRINANGANTIEGNFVGTDVTGTEALGNAGHGVVIERGADGNLIGTEPIGNGWAGVEIVIDNGSFNQIGQIAAQVPASGLQEALVAGGQPAGVALGPNGSPAQAEGAASQRLLDPQFRRLLDGLGGAEKRHFKSCSSQPIQAPFGNRSLRGLSPWLQVDVVAPDVADAL